MLISLHSLHLLLIMLSFLGGSSKRFSHFITCSHHRLSARIHYTLEISGLQAANKTHTAWKGLLVHVFDSAADHCG